MTMLEVTRATVQPWAGSPSTAVSLAMKALRGIAISPPRLPPVLTTPPEVAANFPPRRAAVVQKGPSAIPMKAHASVNQMTISVGPDSLRRAPVASDSAEQTMNTSEHRGNTRRIPFFFASTEQATPPIGVLTIIPRMGMLVYHALSAAS